MSIVSSRGGMHKEVVPLHSNGIPIVVAAQFIECPPPPPHPKKNAQLLAANLRIVPAKIKLVSMVQDNKHARKS